MRVDPVMKVLYPDFYDLVRQPKQRKPAKCMRCGAKTITDRLCNKCSKFVDNQSKMAQEGGFNWVG